MKPVHKEAWMTRVAAFSLRKPITVIMLFTSLLVFGVISARLLPLEHLPEMKLPFFNVEIPYPAATPEEVERVITRPVEDALATLNGVERIGATSHTNGANIGLMFNSDVDVDEMGMLIKEQLDLIRPELPDDVRRIRINKARASDESIMEFRLSGEIELENAYDVINQYLVRPVQRIPGVARVDLQGIEPLQLQIMLDDEKMRRYGIGFNELSQKLQDANFAIRSGNLHTGDRMIRVVPKGHGTDTSQYANLLLNERNVRLRDVATVELVNGERNYGRHLDRKYAVGLEIYKESTANLVEVADAVVAKIDELSKSPQMKGIKLIFLDNRADDVKQSLNAVVASGVIGAVLSILVLFLFLWNIPMALIISLAMPVAITITLGALYFFGMTLNILSLMGLMLAIGMLVDNSVVISESVLHQMADRGKGNDAAVQAGVSEVVLPVMAGTLTSICVFLPIMIGEDNMLTLFLSHVAVAIIVAMLVSLMMSVSVVPMAIKMFRHRIVKDHQVPDMRWLRWLKARYTRVLRFFLNHRWFTFAFIVLIGISGQFANKFVQADEGNDRNAQRSFWLPYHVDGSFTLDRLEQDVNVIEEFLYANQKRFEIESVYSYFEENGFVASKIKLIDADEAQMTPSEVKEAIMKELPKIATGTPSFQWRNSFNNQGLSVYLLGDSHEILREELLPAALFEIRQIEAVSNAQVEQRNRREEIQVEVLRERALQLGLTPEDVARSVNIAMRGMNLRDFILPHGEIPVIMRFYKTGEFRMQQLKSLPIKNERGESIELENVADIHVTSSPQSLRRHNRASSVEIKIDLQEGSNLMETKAIIESAMNRLKRTYPSGYSWSFNNQGGGMDLNFSDLIPILFVGLALIFIVMASLFESTLLTLSVLSGIGFSVVGMLLFFALTGTNFTIMAGIGFLVLMGIVVNNGIVLIDRIRHLREQGMVRMEAVIQAGQDRFRPILMTVATTVFGLLPLSVSSVSVGGGDGPTYYPMARAIIGGLSFSTVITLLVLPSLYIWLDDLRGWFSDRLQRKTLVNKRPRRI